MTKKNIIQTYLERYAEPESKIELPNSSKYQWKYAVVIPACGEDELLPKTLSSIENTSVVSSEILVIIIINAAIDRASMYHESNKKTLAWIERKSSHQLEIKNDTPINLYQWNQLSLLIVNRFNEPYLLPKKQGVGLARKIGCDIAVKLFFKQHISNQWIHNTDGDALVPKNYFHQVDVSSEQQNASCFIYPYRHIKDNSTDSEQHLSYWEAVTDYELWLRYYTTGLKWARSPWAFPSIGSLLACKVSSYAHIRGIPRKIAAEDFYFQNKLAKTGSMIALRGEPIELITRPSERVPFGTGRGTIKITDLKSQGQPFLVYDPQVFYILKIILASVKNWVENNHDEIFWQEIGRNIESAKQDELLKVINQFDFLHALKEAKKRSRDSKGNLNQFNQWFDGFKTLRFIHEIRDHVLGELPIIEAIKQSPFLPNYYNCDPEFILNSLRDADGVTQET